jgi:hypothetical protein
MKDSGALMVEGVLQANRISRAAMKMQGFTNGFVNHWHNTVFADVSLFRLRFPRRGTCVRIERG